jgi:hypothetical protein
MKGGKVSPQYLSQRLMGKYFKYLPGSFSGLTAPPYNTIDIAETLRTRPGGAR